MESLDQSLFIFINSQISNDLFDAVFPVLTDLHKNKFFSQLILPLFLLLWIYKKRWQVVPVLLGVALCIGFVDNFTYRVLKPTFQRQRPPATEPIIQLRTDRFAGYSFPSNHAANNFAGATFLSYCYPALTPVFFAVSSLVAFSRVYVGVHYPGDVLAGAVIGLIFGLFFFKIWVIIWLRVQRRWPLLALPGKATKVGDSDGNKQTIIKKQNR